MKKGRHEKARTPKTSNRAKSEQAGRKVVMKKGKQERGSQKPATEESRR